MAASGRAKRAKAKAMAKLGYVWWPQENSFVWLGYMDVPHLWIEYRPKTKDWGAIGPKSQVHDEYLVGLLATFPDPITAAVWLSVEKADEQAEHRRQQREAWDDALPDN